MDLKLRKDVILVAVEDLVPYSNNAKLHPPEQIEEICAQILLVGWDQPLVIEPDKTIVKGHGRRLAAIRLGLSHVPCIISDAPPDALRAARLGDNTSARTGFDEAKLKAELEKIAFENEGKLPIPTGFKPEEIERIMSGMTPLPDSEVANTPDPEQPPKEKKEKPPQEEGEKQYLVIVDCGDESTMGKVYAEMRERGFECKLM